MTGSVKALPRDTASQSALLTVTLSVHLHLHSLRGCQIKLEF